MSCKAVHKGMAKNKLIIILLWRNACGMFSWSGFLLNNHKINVVAISHSSSAADHTRWLPKGNGDQSKMPQKLKNKKRCIKEEKVKIVKLKRVCKDPFLCCCSV
jgi:hypothetical protein